MYPSDSETKDQEKVINLNKIYCEQHSLGYIHTA